MLKAGAAFGRPALPEDPMSRKTNDPKTEAKPADALTDQELDDAVGGALSIGSVDNTANTLRTFDGTALDGLGNTQTTFDKPSTLTSKLSR